MDSYEEVMQDLLGGSNYNIEHALQERGFNCDFDGDHRITYMKGNLSVSIHWDGDIITETGIPNGFSIWRLGQENRHYVGNRPKNDEELDALLEDS